MNIKSIQIFILSLVGTLFLGCGGLSPRHYVDVKHTLYANLELKQGAVRVKNIVDENGEIDLRTLQPTSPKVMAKYCEDKEDYSCMEKILDKIEASTNRVALLQHYNDLLADNEAHIKNLESIYQQYEPSYLEDKEKLSLEYRLNDETKLYEGEEVPVKDILYIGGNPLKYPKKASHKEDIHNIFPVSVKAFDTRLKKLSKRLKKVYKREVATYKKTIKYLSSFYPLTRAKKMKAGVYTFSVKAPHALPRTKSERKKRVVINIVGKDLKGIYPHKFVAQNRDIRVSFDKKTTRFENLSHKTLHLESLTFFYNGYKQRVPLGDGFAFSEIAPRMSTTADSSMFLTRSFVQASIYPKVTKKKAKSHKVMFGIRLEYRVGKSKKTQLLLFRKKDLLWRFITGW